MNGLKRRLLEKNVPIRITFFENGNCLIIGKLYNEGGVSMLSIHHQLIKDYL